MKQALRRRIGASLLLLMVLLASCGDETATTAKPFTTAANTTAAIVSTTTSSTTTTAISPTSPATTAPVRTSGVITPGLPRPETPIGVPTDTAPVSPPVSPPAPPVSTTAPATVGSDTSNYAIINGSQVPAYGPKGVCTPAALAKAKGPDYEVAVIKDLTMNAEKPNQKLQVVFVGKPIANQADKFYEELEGYVILDNCIQKPGALLLQANPDWGWSQFAPEIKLQDTHKDGYQQIYIQGVVGVKTLTASLFGYDYYRGLFRLQGNFVGDRGAGTERPEFYNGSEKDVAYSAYRGGSDTFPLTVGDVYAWRSDGGGGGKYELVEKHLGYYFEPPAQLEYPQDLVLRYYQALDAKQFDKAYAYLSPAALGGQSLDKYKAGYANTKRVWVESLELMGQSATAPLSDGSYQVKVKIGAEDNVNGKSSLTRFAGTWTVKIAGGKMTLDKASIAVVN